LALLADGTVEAWGSDYERVLGEEVAGDSPTVDSSRPLAVTAVAGATQVAAGGIFALALRGNGSVLSWGDVTPSGTIDDVNADEITQGRPVTVIGISHARQVAAGGYFALALLADNTVLQWGDPGRGYVSAPAPVTGLRNIVAIAAGNRTAYALQSDGTVWAWGDNFNGELGDGTMNASDAPVRIAALGASAVSIAAGNPSATAFAIVLPGRHVGHTRRPRPARVACHRTPRRTTACTVAIPPAIHGVRVQLLALLPRRRHIAVIATGRIRHGRAQLTIRQIRPGRYLVTILVADRRHRTHVAGHAQISIPRARSH
jgi:hypothetical protein